MTYWLIVGAQCQWHVAEELKSHSSYAHWNLARLAGDSEKPRKKIQLRHMQTHVILEVPPEVLFTRLVKVPQIFFTSFTAGPTSVSVMDTVEHEFNASVAVPEPPYYRKQVQGLRTETQDSLCMRSYPKALRTHI